MINPLEVPDSFHAEAAQGWLELGDHLEANEELEKIAPELRAHPHVLTIRCEIYIAAKRWEGALDIATALAQLEPDDSFGWIHRSYCLHRLERTLEARDNLLGVVESFPISATIRYNLACYECQLGNLGQAKHWLGKAFALGDPQELKLAALNDPDLVPLWKDIGKS